MFAEVGDRLIVHNVHLNRPVRDGEILEVRGPEGAPPYLVRWSENGGEALVFPGPDAAIEHLGQKSADAEQH
jgi:Domain of unknown function (DUF1918)